MPANNLRRRVAVLLTLGFVVACSEMPGDRVVGESGMTAQRLGELIVEIDDRARHEINTWQFSVGGLDTAVIYDTNADRMRIVVPIGPADALDAEELTRLMQANFDSALDARYAIAQGLLWGTFIHPLSSLTDEEFVSGLRQAVSVVTTYGDTYSSGEFIFGNGDSSEIERQRLMDQLNEEST